MCSACTTGPAYRDGYGILTTDYVYKENTMERKLEVISKTYNLTVKWNDYKADWEYTALELSDYETGERRVTNEFGGDLDWATRFASHYNLTVPSTEEK